MSAKRTGRLPAQQYDTAQATPAYTANNSPGEATVAYATGMIR